MKNKVIFVCELCNSRNYSFKTNSASSTSFFMGLNKYCSKCKKTTLHNGNR